MQSKVKTKLCHEARSRNFSLCVMIQYNTEESLAQLSLRESRSA